MKNNHKTCTKLAYRLRAKYFALIFQNLAFNKSRCQKKHLLQTKSTKESLTPGFAVPSTNQSTIHDKNATKIILIFMFMSVFSWNLWRMVFGSIGRCTSSSDSRRGRFAVSWRNRLSSGFHWRGRSTTFRYPARWSIFSIWTYRWDGSFFARSRRWWRRLTSDVRRARWTWTSETFLFRWRTTSRSVFGQKLNTRCVKIGNGLPVFRWWTNWRATWWFLRFSGFAIKTDIKLKRLARICTYVSL